MRLPTRRIRIRAGHQLLLTFVLVVTVSTPAGATAPTVDDLRVEMSERLTRKCSKGDTIYHRIWAQSDETEATIHDTYVVFDGPASTRKVEYPKGLPPMIVMTDADDVVTVEGTPDVAVCTGEGRDTVISNGAAEVAVYAEGDLYARLGDHGRYGRTRGTGHFLFVGGRSDVVSKGQVHIVAAGGGTIHTGPGDDNVDLSSLEFVANNDTPVASDPNGQSTVMTGSGDDRVRGSRGDDRIDLGSGDDVSFSLEGTDHTDGGPGNDACDVGPGMRGPTDTLVNCELDGVDRTPIDEGLPMPEINPEQPEQPEEPQQQA